MVTGARPVRGMCLNPRFAGLVGLATLGITAACRAETVEFIGVTLRVDQVNVAVQAKFLGASSLFTNELFLDEPITPGPLFVSTSTPANATVFLGPYQNAGQVLFIRNQSYLPSQNGGPASFNFGWFTGDGTLPLNPDRLPHAVFSYDTADPTTVKVGFEDSFGGGDLDFNDAVYSFTNVRLDVVTVALTPDLSGLSTVPNGEVKAFAPYESSFTNGGSGTVLNQGTLINYGEAGNDGIIENQQHLLNDIPGSLNNAGSVENSGEIRSFGAFGNSGVVNNSGDLLNNGTFVNTGQVINAADAVFHNGGQGTLTNQQSLQNDGTLTNAGTLNNNGTLESTGTLTNEAIGTFKSTSTLTISSGVFGNMGSVEISGDFAVGLGAVVQNGLNAVATTLGTTTNEGGVENSGVLNNLGAVNNYGTWNNNDASFVENAGSITNFVDGFVTNAGTLTNSGTLSNDGTLESTGTLTNEAAGSITSTKTFRISSGQFGNLGSVEISGEFSVDFGAVVENGLNAVATTFGDLTNEGSVENAGLLKNLGTVKNYGNIELKSGGILENLSGAQIENLADYLAKSGSETRNDGQLTNSGTLTIETGASLTGAGNFTQLQNGTTTVNGTVEQTQIVFAGGNVNGSGTIRGFLNSQTGTTLAPGNSPGTLTVDGSALLTGSTLQIELASASLFDTLNVTGDVEFDGGTLEYLFSYTPLPNERFVFLTAGGSITGLDTLTFRYSDNLGGLTFNTLLESSGGQNSLVLVVVPEPVALTILPASLVLLTRRRRRAAR